MFRYELDSEHFFAVYSSGALDFLKGLGVDKLGPRLRLIHELNELAAPMAAPNGEDPGSSRGSRGAALGAYSTDHKQGM